jgi:hypothetical protein
VVAKKDHALFAARRLTERRDANDLALFVPLHEHRVPAKLERDVVDRMVLLAVSGEGEHAIRQREGDEDERAFGGRTRERVNGANQRERFSRDEKPGLAVRGERVRRHAVEPDRRDWDRSRTRVPIP